MRTRWPSLVVVASALAAAGCRVRLPVDRVGGVERPAAPVERLRIEYYQISDG